MMFTQAGDVDITDQHHFVMVLRKYGIVDDVWMICRVVFTERDVSPPAKRSSYPRVIHMMACA